MSAGYAPITLGTDTIGSLISLATRALYTIKPTVGSVDMARTWAVSPYHDAIGGMTKSVIDLATITAALLNPDAKIVYLVQDFKVLRPLTA
jgi:amidase